MSLFRKEYFERKSSSLSGNIRVASPIGHAVVTAILTCFTGGIIFACFTIDYSDKETVMGNLVPESGLVNIISQGKGTILTLQRRSGDLVSEGEILFEIKTPSFLISGDNTGEQRSLKLEQEKTNLIERIKIGDREYKVKVRELERSANKLKNEILHLKESVKNQKKIVSNEKNIYDSYARLFDQSSASSLELSNAENQYIQSLRISADIENEIVFKRDTVQELNDSKTKALLEKEKNINLIQGQIIDLDRRLIEISTQEGYVVRAPVDGVLSSLLVNEGETIDSSKTLATILPTDMRLMAELLVPSRAIGQIELGQNVFLSYDAFPHQKFGFFQGSVSRISQTVVYPSDLKFSDAVREPVFLVNVDIARESFQYRDKTIRLQPGMILSADVVVKKQKLFELLLSPLR